MLRGGRFTKLAFIKKHSGMSTVHFKRNIFPLFLRMLFFLTFIVLIAQHQSYPFIERFFSTEQTDLQNESNPTESSNELMQDMENILFLNFYNITYSTDFQPLLNLVFKQLDTQHFSRPIYDIIGPPPKI